MKLITRRVAALRILAAVAPVILFTRRAMGQAPAASGVDRVPLGKRASMLPGYKSLAMRDVILRPGANTSANNVMANDMVCHCPEGQLRVVQKPGGEFNVKKGDVWACTKGMEEQVWNTGKTVAIMRIIDLLPG